MNIKLIVIGKTNKSYFVEAENEYIKRINKYCKVQYITINELKNAKKLSIPEIKIKEEELLKKHINSNDLILLLDERGKQKTSMEMSKFLQNKMNQSVKNLCFIVGGAYGFNDEFRKKYTLFSLSKMTFSHQMIRIFLLEQIYRGFSIINNEPYHNEG